MQDLDQIYSAMCSSMASSSDIAPFAHIGGSSLYMFSILLKLKSNSQVCNYNRGGSVQRFEKGSTESADTVSQGSKNEMQVRSLSVRRTIVNGLKNEEKGREETV